MIVQEVLGREGASNLVGNVWTPSNGEPVTRVNPVDPEDVVGLIASTTREELDSAIETAVRGQKGWAAVPAPQRGNVLNRCALSVASTQTSWPNS